MSIEDRKKRWRRRWRQRAETLGLCIRCGHAKPARPGVLTCKPCLDVLAAYGRERRRRGEKKSDDADERSLPRTDGNYIYM